MAEGFARVDSRQKVLCRYFMHGVCRMGDSCNFSHDNHSAQPSNSCKYYLKGHCAFADKCRYDHIRPEKLDNLRKVQNGENTQSKGKKEIRPVTRNPAALSKSSEKVRDKGSESRLTTLSTTFSKLCVDAPEFIPRQYFYDIPKNSVSEDVSYAKAVGSCSEPEKKLEVEEMKQSKNNELCPFFLFSGECRSGDKCNYIHGTVCEFCQMACLHPRDSEQRDKHMQECMKYIEADMNHSFAIARSKEQTCGICYETVWERNLSTEQRFGILPNCSHCFCLDCIRKWRQSKQFESKLIRSCPECRTQSDYIIPSRYWVDDKEKEEKQKLLAEYRSALSAKHCKYFKQGKGDCPFGNKCFYLHALSDGTVKDVGPPKKKKRVTDSTDLQMYLHNMVLWEFIEQREERLENIQSSLHTLLLDFEAQEIMDFIRPEYSFSDEDSD